MRERPPVRAILEHVAQHAAVARHRQDRRPLVDRHAGIIGLHELRAARRAAVELHDLGHAGDAVPDQAREDSPLALGPLPEVALAGVEEALRVAAPFAGRDRLAEYFDMLAGHHLQAAATEYALDLLGRHRGPASAMQGARRAPRRALAPRDQPREACAARLAAHDQHRRIIPAAARAREREQPAAAARERRGSVQHAAQVPRLDVLVHAVAAKHEHLAARERDLRDIGHCYRAVADHARRIVARPAGRRRLARDADRCRRRSRVARARRRGAHAIDAAVADPRDEPSRQQRFRSPAHKRHRRRAGGRAAARDAAPRPRGRRRAAPARSPAASIAPAVERRVQARRRVRGSPTPPSRRRPRRRRRRTAAQRRRARCASPR